MNPSSMNPLLQAFLHYQMLGQQPMQQNINPLLLMLSRNGMMLSPLMPAPAPAPMQSNTADNTYFGDMSGMTPEEQQRYMALRTPPGYDPAEWGRINDRFIAYRDSPEGRAYAKANPVEINRPAGTVEATMMPWLKK